MPSALSRDRELVEITGTSTTGLLPSFMMDALAELAFDLSHGVITAFSLSAEIDIHSSSYSSFKIGLPQSVNKQGLSVSSRFETK